MRWATWLGVSKPNLPSSSWHPRRRVMPSVSWHPRRKVLISQSLSSPYLPVYSLLWFIVVHSHVNLISLISTPLVFIIRSHKHKHKTKQLSDEHKGSSELDTNSWEVFYEFFLNIFGGTPTCFSFAFIQARFIFYCTLIFSTTYLFSYCTILWRT